MQSQNCIIRSMTNETTASFVKTLVLAAALAGFAPPSQARVTHNSNALGATSHMQVKPRDCSIEPLRTMGPVIELAVTCGKATGVVSYSSADALYCSPNLECFASLKPIIHSYILIDRHLCGGCRLTGNYDEQHRSTK